MSSVCSSWIRSDVSDAAAPVLAALSVAGGDDTGTAAVQAAVAARTRAANIRRTARDASGSAVRLAGSARQRSFVRAVLELVQPVVDAALREQVAVRAHLHHAALMQHDDPV